MYSFRFHPSLKHSLYSAGKSTVLILALFFLLFFSVFHSPLHPMHRITVLRLIRSSIFLFGSLLLIRLLLPESSERKTKEKTACMLSSLAATLWFGIFPPAWFFPGGYRKLLHLSFRAFRFHSSFSGTDFPQPESAPAALLFLHVCAVPAGTVRPDLLLLFFSLWQPLG